MVIRLLFPITTFFRKQKSLFLFGMHSGCIRVLHFRFVPSSPCTTLLYQDRRRLGSENESFLLVSAKKMVWIHIAL